MFKIGFKMKRLCLLYRGIPTALLGYISLGTTAENQLIVQSPQIYKVKCYAGNIQGVPGGMDKTSGECSLC